MSELSRRSGVPVPTIKYYLREQLLPPGEQTSPNQARYGELHLRRLRLIRAMIEIGGLSVSTAKDVVQAVDSPELALAQVFQQAQLAVSQTDLYAQSPSDEARERIDAVVVEQGWQVGPDNPGRTAAANVIDAFLAADHADLLELSREYAPAALQVARADLAAVGKQPNVETMAETIVAGTVLGDALFAALRRIAQEHVTTELYSTYPTSHSTVPGTEP